MDRNGSIEFNEQQRDEKLQKIHLVYSYSSVQYETGKYRVHCTVYGVHGTLDTGQWTVCTLHKYSLHNTFTWYTLHWTVDSVHCIPIVIEPYSEECGIRTWYRSYRYT
jgi:hypothetical protein